MDSSWHPPVQEYVCCHEYGVGEETKHQAISVGHLGLHTGRGQGRESITQCHTLSHVIQRRTMSHFIQCTQCHMSYNVTKQQNITLQRDADTLTRVHKRIGGLFTDSKPYAVSEWYCTTHSSHTQCRIWWLELLQQ